MTPARRELRDELAATPERVIDAVGCSGRSPEVAPAPGEWSAREVLLHLAAVEEGVWQARLDALASEAFPHWSWIEPGLWSGPGDDTCEGAFTAFVERRAATVARLDGLGAGGWTRRGRHDTFGILDVAAMLRILLDHDAKHIAQIRR